MTVTKGHPEAAAFVDAMNVFSGRGGIPVGMVREGKTPEAAPMLSVPLAMTHADGRPVYPRRLGSGAEAPEAVALLTRILAAQPHYSETRIIDCATSLSSSAAKVEVAHNTMLANAIDVALRTPGKSVALIPLGPLTRKGGVLDLLGNKGVVIHQPET